MATEKKTEKSFEASMERLEQIVADMEPNTAVSAKKPLKYSR